MMEWEAAAIVLDVRPYGEADAVASVMTEAHGRHRGLTKGGASRSKAAIWQAGNLLQVRWTARLADQLGGFTGELIHAGAALAMQDRLSLSIMSAACAIAEAGLPEQEPHPRVFARLVRLISLLSLGDAALTELVRWEVALLSDLGYGLDISACAVTGRNDDLVYVSPRTGRAVSRQGAGEWASRLLRLPRFLTDAEGQGDPPGPAAWRDGLLLTGHFLARDVFGTHNRPLPQARRMLYDRVAAMAEVAEAGTGTLPGDGAAGTTDRLGQAGGGAQQEG